jgi:hypothetical protein
MNVNDIADMCRTVADGAGAAWDDAPETCQGVLKAASDTLTEAAGEIEQLRGELDRIETYPRTETFAAATKPMQLLAQLAREDSSLAQSLLAEFDAYRRYVRGLDGKVAEYEAIEDRPLDDDSNCLLNRCEAREPLSRADQRELFAWFEERGGVISDYEDEIQQFREKKAAIKAKTK